MANQEHLNLLKQGVEMWNQWRKEYPETHPNLSGSSLIDTDLHMINLSDVNLSEASLADTNLSNANLNSTNLSKASLHMANLTHADLGKALLIRASLGGADLSGANLRGANLFLASLFRANLCGADLSGAYVVSTIFGDVDLGSVKGLDALYHLGPSTIGIDTIIRSAGRLPDSFLQGVGVPDNLMAYARSLRNSSPNFTSCFISYSSKDELFAKQLHADLQNEGVRCWFAPEDMKIGDKIRARIDEAIHLHEKLLLLLSKHAMASAWVEDEVEAALEKEQRQQREVLFPIRLDEQVMQATQAWAAKLRRTRHIGDFTHWTDPQAYQQAFERLLRDLKAQP